MTKISKLQWASFFFLSLALGAIAGGFSSYMVLSSQGDEAPSVINFENISYTEAWEEAADAVLSVVALKDLSEYYDRFSAFGFDIESEGLSEVSSGSAFIVTPDGLAITNRHVVEDEFAEYVVVMADGTELNAEVLDRDTLNDIALLQLSGDEELIGNLPHLDLANSDAIKVGQPVLAIGNALGEYSHTTTAGIISALDRQVLVSSGRSTESLVDLLQTDAAINPGNSGGPLVDLNGDVLGMNTAVDTTASGIGFAIPSNDVAAVLASYQEFGRIVRPFLGVRYIMVDAGVQRRFELDVEHGAFLIGDRITELPAVIEGGSAEKAGLQARDVILEFGGQELNDEFTLSNALASYFVGETVLLKVWREGEMIELDITLEEGG